jgi:hypothetical protein
MWHFFEIYPTVRPHRILREGILGDVGTDAPTLLLANKNRPVGQPIDLLAVGFMATLTKFDTTQKSIRGLQTCGKQIHHWIFAN